jgi:NAD+ synthase (glutamine-hydrolysing)
MRIALAQIDPVLCDFEANAEKILNFARKAEERHCDLVLFPEASLFGYHPFDLLELPQLVEAQKKSIAFISKNCPEAIGLIFGAITETGLKQGKPYYNSAVFVERGKKPRFFHKELLPTGDVFDEARFIAQGNTAKNVFRFRGQKILVTICEDIWAWPNDKGRSSYDRNPLREIAKKSKDIDVVLNLSASPYFPGKEKIRDGLVKKTAALFKAPMVYCNMVGAQDEIIFDGQSFALDSKGREIARLIPFEEDLGVVDLTKMEGMKRPEKLSDVEKLRRALALGIRDFCLKTGLEKVHLGLSGGIDSAVVACLAVDALGPSKVVGFGLPSQFNAEESLVLAERLAKNLGIQFQTVSIQKTFEAFRATLDPAFQVKDFSLVHENLQARIRGLILMSYSNVTGSMLLSTGNKSELAAGYATLYGDMCGGLMPIGDLTKKDVYALARLYNQDQELIPARIIDREPSAELRPNQKDQDTLPPYDELDAAVEKIVTEGKIGISSAEKFLLPALLRSEFKRWQAPPILKVSKHSFGRGRRWPVAHRALKVLSKK